MAESFRPVYLFFIICILQAVIAHKPSHGSEVELQVGDNVAVAGNHWDGYSKGRNLRTNQVGLYPSFKVEDRVKTAVFPTYDQVPKEL